MYQLQSSSAHVMEAYVHNFTHSMDSDAHVNLMHEDQFDPEHLSMSHAHDLEIPEVSLLPTQMTDVSD